MSSQPMDDDLLLSQVATGDLSPTAAPVLARAAADPQFAKRLAELQSLQQGLDDAAQLERDVLREAVGGDRAANGKPWWLRRGLQVAIAAALLATAMLFWLQPPSPDSIKLGNDFAATLTVVDRGALKLQWSGQLRPGDYYVVALRNVDDGSEIARSDLPLTAAEWLIPDPARLPANVRIEVMTYDARQQPGAVRRVVLAVPR